MVKEVAIIIPTYNSSQTIVQLLKDITKRYKSAQVFVIDDNSPDGTSKLVKKNFTKNKSVNLIIRSKKLGRGGAVLYGLKMALKINEIKYFIEMDSDLCHDPKYITQFLKTSKEKNCDVVVASRYLRSSKITKWKIKRRILSWMSNHFIHLILGLPLTDATNGFRCYSRKALTSVDFKKIKSRGFIVLSEFAYYLKQSDNKFCEVPINFKDDVITKSNMSLKEIIAGFSTILRLRYSK